MITNNQGHTIKARHDYQDCIQARHASEVEVIRVTGWESVTVGVGAEERQETWCRVRFADGGLMLAHPDRLEPVGAHLQR